MFGAGPLSQIWRSYWVLAVLNAVDLLLTYTAVEGGVDEANVLLRPIVLTPWPLAIKTAALVLLALALAQAGRSAPRLAHILQMLRLAVGVYLVVTFFHVLGLRVID
ncbi:MAG: DUF5658 family protein [Armatimonadota bacterium]|nr:DUF5658 family protein [Armatimonadota bacterium]MDR7428459.1 DUF5658 family protein [Armatimonadota bacterium]MDR7465297.1 DUF5658 family protein [Armatimonadota bacterium]MDR7469136.1 DUF5658 family protein [Armatimonadota bacterium]MDR7476046.1 DUF5658 family protein [Armatimonadota bacterium]